MVIDSKGRGRETSLDISYTDYKQVFKTMAKVSISTYNETEIKNLYKTSMDNGFKTYIDDIRNYLHS